MVEVQLQKQNLAISGKYMKDTLDTEYRVTTFFFLTIRGVKYLVTMLDLKILVTSQQKCNYHKSLENRNIPARQRLYVCNSFKLHCTLPKAGFMLWCAV